MCVFLFSTLTGMANTPMGKKAFNAQVGVGVGVEKNAESFAKQAGGQQNRAAVN
jgi:hypothetical protein